MGRESFIKKVSAHHFIGFTNRRTETNTRGKAASTPQRISVPRASHYASKACWEIVRLYSGRSQIRKSAGT